MATNEVPGPITVEGSQVLTRQLAIAPSMADSTGHLSLQAAFSLFSDSANAHADLLGVGYFDLIQQDLFWLAVKAKVHFQERPQLGETVTLATWPETPGRIRSIRHYQMCRGDQVLVCGKTEWAIINWETQDLVPPRDLFPEGFAFPEETALDQPFARVPDKFQGIEAFAEYRVRSTDIDVGKHMNNAAYARALVGTFSNEELAALEVRDMDISYRTSCFEGDLLTFQRRDAGDAGKGLDIRIAKGEETIVLAHME